MRFRIEKDTKVIARTEGSTFHIKNGFAPIATEVRVTFDMGDLWFAPLDTDIHGSGTEALFAANIGGDDQNSYKYIIRNFYGFNLPKNERKVEHIIVERENVCVIQPESPPEDVRSFVREEKRMLRRMNQQGGFYFPGKLNK